MPQLPPGSDANSWLLHGAALAPPRPVCRSPPHPLTHTHTHSFPPFPTHSPATAGTVYGHNADDVPVQPGNSSAAVDSQTLDQKTGYRTCELRTAVRLALACPLGSWARPGAGQPVAALSGCAGRAGRGLGPQRRPTPGAECECTPTEDALPPPPLAVQPCGPWAGPTWPSGSSWPWSPSRTASACAARRPQPLPTPPVRTAVCAFLLSAAAQGTCAWRPCTRALHGALAGHARPALACCRPTRPLLLPWAEPAVSSPPTGPTPHPHSPNLLLCRHVRRSCVPAAQFLCRPPSRQRPPTVLWRSAPRGIPRGGIPPCLAVCRRRAGWVPPGGIPPSANRLSRSGRNRQPRGQLRVSSRSRFLPTARAATQPSWLLAGLVTVPGVHHRACRLPSTLLHCMCSSLRRRPFEYALNCVTRAHMRPGKA